LVNEEELVRYYGISGLLILVVFVVGFFYQRINEFVTNLVVIQAEKVEVGT
jgi:hypothetical protein